MTRLVKPQANQKGETLNLLLVEPDHNDYTTIVSALRRHDYEQFNITHVSRIDDAIRALGQERYDLVISEFNLPDSRSAGTVYKLGQYAESVPIIMLASIRNEHVAQMAINNGIEDYLAKDYLNDIHLLFKTINFSIERHRIKSQLRRARTEYDYMATHDVICAIPNRLLFLDRLNHALSHSDRSGDSLALVFINLDDFKPVNYDLGHDAGDFILSTVARRIQNQVRESDTVARISGDEFAVLLPCCDDALNLDQALQNIKRVLSEPFMYQNLTCSVTASIGVATYPKDAVTRHKLMYFADLAMCEAKEQGGNRIRYFRVSMAAGLQHRRQLENDLRDALDKDELVLNYQPVLRLGDDALYGVEVLLHWPRSGKDGDMGQCELLRVAEDSRLAVRLGHYMLKNLSIDMQRLVQSGAQRLMINCSIMQLRHNGFVDTLSEITKLWNNFGRECFVEIAESDMARDKKSALSAIRKLNKCRVRCVIDHFGAGQYSLSYLKTMGYGIDVVKIDPGYICDADSDECASSVLKAMISLIEDLGLACIALGVNTAEQDACIRSLGCQIAQGLYYSRNVKLNSLPREASNISLLQSRK